ncbi:MAG: hypothetical protein WCH05_05310 [Chlorobiaceae bacterium]
MAQEEKKGGLFARFRKSPAVAPAPSAPSAPAVKSGIEPSAPLAAQKPVSQTSASPATAPAEPSVDTAAAIDQFCKALLDISNSQLKVVELALTTLAGIIDQAAARAKAEK